MSIPETATAEPQTFASISEAAAHLTAQREKREAPAPEVADEGEPNETQQNSEAAPQAAEEPAADPIEDNPAEDESGEDAEPERPVIEPPQFLGKQDREAFAALPREAQEIVGRIEEQGRRAVSQRLSEVAQERNALQAQRQHLQSVTEGVSGYVSDLDRQIAFYSEIDFDFEVRDPDNAGRLDEIRQAEAHFNILQRQRAEAIQAQERATVEELRTHHAQVGQALHEHAPHLSPLTRGGAERLGQMTQFLRTAGADQETLNWLPAWAFPLVEDAMKYREQQKRIAAKAAPSQTPKPPAGPTVAPVTQGRQGSPQQQELKRLQAKGKLTMAESLREMELKRQLKR
jgi:hypothetical protein